MNEKEKKELWRAIVLACISVIVVYGLAVTFGIEK